MTRRTLCLYVAACFASIAICGTAAPVRVALVSAKQEAEELEKLRILVEPRLSQQPEIELLERAEMERIMAEHQIDLAASRRTLADCSRLGNLLNADVLLFLDARKGDGGNAYSVKATDVRTGLQLSLANIPPGSFSLTEKCEVIISCVRSALAKRDSPMLAIIAVFPFVSNDLGDRYDADTIHYQALVEQIAGAMQGCFLVDVMEAREIIEEKEVALRIASAVEHPYPIFARGTYRNDGTGTNRHVALTLVLQDKEGRIARREMTTPPGLAEAALRHALSDSLSAFNQKTRGESSSLDGLREASVFWREARRLQSLGQAREALACLESALVLLPEDAVATSNMFEGITVPSSPFAARANLRDAVKAEILQAYIGLSVWEYADAGQKLIDELCHSTLPPGMGFWDSLRYPCGRILEKHRRWEHIDPEARATAAMRLHRIRDSLIGLYEQRPKGNTGKTMWWQAMVKESFPRIFCSSSDNLITSGELECYLDDLSRAVIAFSSFPESDVMVVDAMGEFASGEKGNVAAINPFLHRLERALSAPDGRWLCEYARLKWDTQHRFDLDRDVLAVNRYEAEALCDEILKVSRPVQTMTDRRKALVKGLEGIARKDLNFAPKPSPPKPPDQIGQPMASAKIFPQVLPGVPNGFAPISVVFPKPQTQTFDVPSIQSWERFVGDIDLLVVRVPERGYFLMKLEEGDVLAPFLPDGLTDPNQCPVSIQFDAGVFYVSYRDRLVICDPAGHVQSVLTCGKDFPEGALGSGACLGAGLSMWSGMIRSRRGSQTWLARVDIRAETNRVQILHEAREQQGDAETSADIGFWPTFAVHVGGQSSAKVIVGRGDRTKPLLVDCNTREVKIFPHILGDSHGGAYNLTDSPFVRDDQDKSILYWIDNGTLVRFDTVSLTTNAACSLSLKLIPQIDVNPYYPKQRCLLASGGRVLFGFQSRDCNNLDCVLGVWDSRTGAVRILKESFMKPPMLGTSSRHGLILNGELRHRAGLKVFGHIELDELETDKR